MEKEFIFIYEDGTVGVRTVKSRANDEFPPMLTSRSGGVYGDDPASATSGNVLTNGFTKMVFIIMVPSKNEKLAGSVHYWGFTVYVESTIASDKTGCESKLCKGLELNERFFNYGVVQ